MASKGSLCGLSITLVFRYHRGGMEGYGTAMYGTAR